MTDRRRMFELLGVTEPTEAPASTASGLAEVEPADFRYDPLGAQGVSQEQMDLLEQASTDTFAVRSHVEKLRHGVRGIQDVQLASNEGFVEIVDGLEDIERGARSERARALIRQRKERSTKDADRALVTMERTTQQAVVQLVGKPVPTPAPRTANLRPPSPPAPKRTFLGRLLLGDEE